MRAHEKQHRQIDADRRRRQRRTKLVIGTIVGMIAFAFAVSSFAPPGEAPDVVKGGFRRITVDELKELFDRGEVTIIDVRDSDAYLRAHIPGALQIPLTRIDGEIEYLPKGKRIVTYCTCPAEESSGQAVQILEHRGVTNAAALIGGLKAWQQRGYPVAAGMPAGR